MGEKGQVPGQQTMDWETTLGSLAQQGANAIGQGVNDIGQGANAVVSVFTDHTNPGDASQSNTQAPPAPTTSSLSSQSQGGQSGEKGQTMTAAQQSEGQLAAQAAALQQAGDEQAQAQAAARAQAAANQAHSDSGIGGVIDDIAHDLGL